ncbi:MAG: pyridoxal-dependent decarboxylase, exosortase A system-associated [Pseudomonadota bacterium]
MSREHTHSATRLLEFDGDVLLWGGRKVTDIAAEVGTTPFYAYDRARMSQRVKTLRAAMPEKLQIHYAMKANPMPDVVNHMAGLVDGLDVASAGELSVALQSGTEPKDISFAGPGKQDAELTAAIEAGITLNMESFGELRRIGQLASELNKQANVAVRVNPSFELKTAGMKMGGRPSQFGVDAELVPEMLAEIESLGLHFRGLHVFSGSQNLKVEAIVESLQKTVDLVIDLSRATTMKFEVVNLGGGLGIPYFPKEEALDLADLSEAYGTAVETLTRELGDPELIIELGRFLVGEAGIYVCRVVDVKESRGTRFAVCDGGLHHHLAVTGNFGQVLRKNYPVVGVERRAEEPQLVTVVGPLCTPLDLLADRMLLDKLDEGSMVAVLQSGAYGRSASPHRFLSHPGCSEICL